METTLKSRLAFKFIAIFTLMAVLSSCSEESVNAGDVEDVDSEEMAEIIAGSVSKDSQGMSEQMEGAAEEVEQLAEQGTECGESFSSDFSLSSSEDLLISYDYSFEYDYVYLCDEQADTTALDFTMKQSGAFDAPRFGSTDTSNGGWVVGGLDDEATEYSFAGNYERSGLHSSKIRNKNSYDFDLSIGFSNVKMNKEDYIISEGTGTFNVSGVASNGNNFSVDGTIEFLGDQVALVTINGDSYLIDLNSCEVEAA